MESLVEKINIHTASGPPNVSELIELQELARSLKVPRASLEKMIAEAISSNPEKEITSAESENTIVDSPYTRTDYDSARDSFDAEMNQRREVEAIPERNEIEFNRPEIVFKKMDDPFADKEEAIEQRTFDEPSLDLKDEVTTPIESISNLETEAILDPISDPNESIDEIQEHIKEINENTAALEQASREKMEQVQELMKKKHEEASAESQRVIDEAKRVHEEEVEKQEAQFAEAEKLREQERIEKETTQKIDPLDNLFDDAGSEGDDLIDLIETIKDSKRGTIEFGDAVDNLENVAQKDEINDWVANSNREERIRAEELARKSLKTNQSSDDRSFERDDTDYGAPSTLQSAKSAYIVAVAALVLSILIGFVGGVIGIFGVTKANGDLQKIKANPKSFEPGALSKLKNARTMSIIAIVIAAFKFFKVFYFGRYFF